MARQVRTGKSGAVKIATSTGGGSYDDPTEGTYETVAEVRSWSVEHNMDTVEYTNMSSDGIRKYLPTFKTWTGTVELYIPFDDATQDNEILVEDVANATGAIVVGDQYFFQLYVDDSADANSSYDGYGYVTGVSRSVAFDGMAEMTITVQGNSDLTISNAATGYVTT
jgi:predicted secreted protein